MQNVKVLNNLFHYKMKYVKQMHMLGLYINKLF